MKRSLKILTILFFGFTLLSLPQVLYAKSGKSPGIININDGDIKALSTLPGIGKSTAEKIIQYRTKHGKFKKKEEISNVRGISTKKFEKIKNLIAISEKENTQTKEEQ